MLTVLVTGALGFCGVHLLARLSGATDVRIVGIDRGTSRLPPAGVRSFEYVTVDLRDATAVDQVVRTVQPDQVFHLAGTSEGTATEIYAANVLGTVNLLDALRRHQPEARVVTVGSAAEYGFVGPEDLPLTEDHECRPVGNYGVSKHAATLVALDFARRLGMPVAVARLFNVVGPGIPNTLVVGAVLERARKALQSREEAILRVGNVDSQRDFVAVEDVADAMISMISGDAWGEVFNICSGVPVTIRSVLTELLSHADRPLRLEVDPALVRQDEVRVAYGSNEKARRAFAFSCRVPLAECLRAAFRAAVEPAP